MSNRVKRIITTVILLILWSLILFAGPAMIANIIIGCFAGWQLGGFNTWLSHQMFPDD